MPGRQGQGRYLPRSRTASPPLCGKPGTGRNPWLPVLVMGVETEAELGFPVAERCHAPQGSLRGRPLPIGPRGTRLMTRLPAPASGSSGKVRPTQETGFGPGLRRAWG